MELLDQRFCTFYFMKYCQMALQTGLSFTHSMQAIIVLIVPHSHQLLVLSDFSVFASLISVKLYVVSLIYIFLIPNETDYYVRCLLTIWLSFSINFLLISFAHFLIDLLSFPYYSYLATSDFPNQTVSISS